MRSLCLLLLIAACASPLRLYEGAAQPRTAVARIEPHDLFVYAVNGAELDPDDRLDRRPIELPPGEHVVRIEWSMDTPYPTLLPAYPRGAGYYFGAERVGIGQRYRRYFVEIRLAAEAGHTYRGVWVVPDGGGEDALRQPALWDVSRR